LGRAVHFKLLQDGIVTLSPAHNSAFEAEISRYADASPVPGHSIISVVASELGGTSTEQPEMRRESDYVALNNSHPSVAIAQYDQNPRVAGNEPLASQKRCCLANSV
jgi:hypothetical protein